jgi:glucose-6-phosphate 1-dehydrogenase
MNGDATLYTRGDALEETWKIVDPVLNAWKHDKNSKMYEYPSGTWGPLEATQLILQSGYLWRNSCSRLSHECNCVI